MTTVAELFQFIGIVAIGLLIVKALDFFRRSRLPETLTSVDPDDPELQAAYANAHQSLPYFWEKRDSALNPEDYFVKVRIEDEYGAEHFWLENPALDGDQITGIVGNDPGVVRCVEVGQKVSYPTSQISDWMYTEGDYIHGNFTARVTARPHNMGAKQYAQLMEKFAPLPDIEA